MGLDTLHDTRWLRSRPSAPGFQTDKIDAEAGIIYDVVMVEEGPAKGHGVHLEAEFISAITAYDQATFGERGLKARFGHPSASGETMGTQMGIFRNFRKRKQDGKMQEIADLHLLDAAEESPTHPGMRSWVLKMAAEQPDFIMSSIVFRGSGYYQRKPNGHKYELMPDLEWGGFLNYKEEYGNVYVEFDAENGAQHFYTDLVEQGAATDNLFSNKINPDFFVSRAHDWLDDNPDIRDFVKQNPERVQAFLQRIGISVQQPQPKKMSKFSLMKWLNGESQEGEPAAADLDALQTELQTAKNAMASLQGEKDALENRVKELSTQVDTLQANLTALKDEAEALKTDATEKANEIERLKSEAADTHTGAPTTPSTPGGKRAYHDNPIYQKALAMRAKQQN